MVALVGPLPASFGMTSSEVLRGSANAPCLSFGSPIRLFSRSILPRAICSQRQQHHPPGSPQTLFGCELPLLPFSRGRRREDGDDGVRIVQEMCDLAHGFTANDLWCVSEGFIWQAYLFYRLTTRADRVGPSSQSLMLDIVPPLGCQPLSF